MLSKALAKSRIATHFKKYNALHRPVFRRGFSTDVTDPETDAVEQVQAQAETEVVQVEQQHVPKAVSRTIGQESQHPENPNVATQNDFTQMLYSMQEQELAENDQYLKMLNNVDARQKFFAALTTQDPSKHHEVNKVKSKINQLIQEEIGEMDFKKQIGTEELAALESDVYQEVTTNSSFYFNYDAKKVDKNLAVYNFEAPGNKYRHPNVILPHEHCDIQHYVDTKDLTDDKLFEIYAYYSLLVDMHIAQIRPGNIIEKSYIPPHMNQVAIGFKNDLNLNNMFFEHYHRWREPTRELFDAEKRFAEALKNQPTTDHYDHDKGTKYDVDWTEDQKFPHVATRLGFPIMREEPIERIFGIERAPAHPGYQFQPFVQTPPLEPDAELNFAAGEVIYENARVGEWIKFWKASALVLFGMSPGFYLFEIYQGDGAPSLQWMADNWNWFDIPRQFQDGAGWNTHGIRYCDDHDYMNIQYGAKRSIVRPSHTMYVATLAGLIYSLDLDYVTKMTYNKDKDLVFVKKPDMIWGETEHVYEMHHLEQMVPSPVTAVKNMSANDPNGILVVQDMAEKEYMKFYKDTKYWNMDLRDEFMSETRTLWEGNMQDKRSGRIFQSLGAAESPDMRIAMDKIDKEMEEAVKKHGKVELPVSHVEEFYDRIEKNKQNIISRA